MRRYLAAAKIGTLYIEPGSPWENGYAESFHGRLRDELLNTESFADLVEAKALAASWQNEYNHRRPHSSLGYQTPAAFAARCRRATTDADAAEVDAAETDAGALPPHPRQGLCPWTPASSPPPEEGAASWVVRNMVPTLIATGT